MPVALDEAGLKALMLAAVGGEARAQRAFLEGMAVLLRGYFRRRLPGDPSEAEDLLQETLIAIHTRRESYDPAYPVTAWAHAIARYRLIDHWRRTKRRGVAVPVEEADALLEAPESDAAEARMDAAVLLATLPPKQSEAIRLVKLEEKSVREAAALTGRGESDIKVSIHRGLKKLAQLMAAQAGNT
jgi:RNA polymerase sigma-70 factor (ECF subfamily)